MCQTYIIHSKYIDKYYSGFTCDEITERIRKHNTNHQGFTGKANDWALAWVQSFRTKAEAQEMEKKIKQWKSRTKIEKLIGSVHPDAQQSGVVTGSHRNAAVNNPVSPTIQGLD